MSRNFSLGELKNMTAEKVSVKKEAIHAFIKNIADDSKHTLNIGFKIVWFGFCFSTVVYMTIRAIMFAL